jgi:hypothetical protein
MNSEKRKPAISGELYVERFEGDIAVCERGDGGFEDIQLSSLPEGTKPGDVLVRRGSGFVVDAAETESRARKAGEMLDELWV